ncbi:MAG: cell division/cell wall cluster transcriptional repressor MraZ [Rickettsiales bacterium]|nr:cell division/cell wall cluster transcriptional repressor MraZ [Rickettsiales bacterium]
MPSQFRNVLQQGSGDSLVLYESSLNKCLEGCSLVRLEELSRRIDCLDPFSEERDAFAAIVLGGSAQLSFDRDGRILLPRHLLEFAGIRERATFIGKGQIFELWNSESFGNYITRARTRVGKNRSMLRDAK